jgi:hypothetical protein
MLSFKQSWPWWRRRRLWVVVLQVVVLEAVASVEDLEVEEDSRRIWWKLVNINHYTSKSEY